MSNITFSFLLPQERHIPQPRTGKVSAGGRSGNFGMVGPSRISHD